MSSKNNNDKSVEHDEPHKSPESALQKEELTEPTKKPTSLKSAPKTKKIQPSNLIIGDSKAVDLSKLAIDTTKATAIESIVGKSYLKATNTLTEQIANLTKSVAGYTSPLDEMAKWHSDMLANSHLHPTVAELAKESLGATALESILGKSQLSITNSLTEHLEKISKDAALYSSPFNELAKQHSELLATDSIGAKFAELTRHTLGTSAIDSIVGNSYLTATNQLTELTKETAGFSTYVGDLTKQHSELLNASSITARVAELAKGSLSATTFDAIIGKSSITSASSLTEQIAKLTKEAAGYTSQFEELVKNSNLAASNSITAQIAKLAKNSLGNSTFEALIGDSGLAVASSLSEQIANLSGFKTVGEIYTKQHAALAGIDSIRDIVNSNSGAISSIRDIQDLINEQNLFNGFEELNEFIDDSVAIEEDFKSSTEAPKQELNRFYDSVLTASQRKIVLFTLNAILTIFLSLISSYIYENYISAKSELKSVSSKREVKSLLRTSPNFDKSALRDYRVAVGDNLNVRKSPSMKAKVVTQLKIGSLFEVIDKSNKSWILIEYEDENLTVKGWVSRKYTTTVN